MIYIVMMCVFIICVLCLLLLNSHIKLRESKAKLKIMTKEKIRFISYYELLTHLILLSDPEIQLKNYCNSHDWNRIAIYGYGPLGMIVERLVKEAGLELVIIFDRYAAKYNSDIPIKYPDQMTEECPFDVVLVTPIFDFAAIQRDLSCRTDKPIVNIEEIVYSE